MTPEEQRIAIAETCGWRWFTNPQADNVCKWMCQPDCQPFEHWRITTDLSIPVSKMGWISTLPDYLNDLNAMHEAEKILDMSGISLYLTELNKYPQHGVFTAASQRAEAFLKTIGKWKD